MHYVATRVYTMNLEKTSSYTLQPYMYLSLTRSATGQRGEISTTTISHQCSNRGEASKMARTGVRECSVSEIFEQSEARLVGRPAFCPC